MGRRKDHVNQFRVKTLSVFLFVFLSLTSASRAEAQYFGRNKVQYRNFETKILRTEHFDVYYYDEERTAVLDAARMAERSYARLSKILSHQFKKRKPLLLYASHTDFQQTNALSGFIDESTGGVTEAYKARIIVPFSGSYADFDHVLNHEMVHAFQYDVMFSKAILNEATPYNARMPLWFMEGMAEYLSIGRIDPHTVSWLRDAVLSGYMRNIGEMSQRDDYLSYRFGQSLWSYVGSKWGDEVIGIILQKAPRMGVERAFTSTLGFSLQELSREWETEVRKQYVPQLADYQTPESFSQKLAKHEQLEDPWYLAPAISPDGNTMAVLTQRSGYSFDLWLADAHTGKFKKRLVDASKSASFESLRYMTSSIAFAPDGNAVAFVGQSNGYDVLYIYDLKKEKVVRKLKFKLNGITAPTYSPDGKYIAFSGNVGGISDLFYTTLDGQLTRLTNDKFADLVPSWSPDGKSIAFTTDRGPSTSFETLRYGNYQVAIMDVASRAVSVLPNQEAGKNHNPVWSPDSKQLIWVSDASGTNNLVLYDLQSQSLRRLTDVLSGVIAVAPTSPVLAWSKSGRFLFNYFEKAGYSVYGVDDPTNMTASPQAVVASSHQSQILKFPNSQIPKQDAFTRSYYKSAQGIRASADAPVTVEKVATLSIKAMMDSVVEMPDTAEFESRDYKVKLTPDAIGRPTIGAQAGGSYGSGLYGGSYITLSDMLGNHNLVFAGNVNGSFSDAEVVTGYSMQKRRWNFTVVGQQMPMYRYYGGGYFSIPVSEGVEEPVAANVFQRDVIRSMQASVSYPFSQFSRFEAGVSGISYKSEMLYRGYFQRTREDLNRTEHLWSLGYWEPMAALVYDNSLFGWTGPIDGRRYRLQLSKPMGDYQFNEAMVDFRNYANFKSKVVLATRFTAMKRTGRDSDRFLVYWGGPYFVRGYDAGTFNLTGDECERSRNITTGTSISQCPVRDQLIGSNAAMVNTELRFPIIKELQIGFLGNFPPVDLVTFFDGGVAWNNRVCADASLLNPNECGKSEKVKVVWDRTNADPYLVREPLFSYGVGLRMNIFYTILRLDYAIPANRPDHGGVFSISFGPSF